ncbi:hypothetical protein BDF21DRAFT_456100 [Thamnidium elegans]|uniref:4-coumarate-CoA ligase n=1 Tax=Thamnidium elegans TaxID=101142 RepID=A0A8H7SRY6_9FUNG|nr:hypothetical protein INT48_003524 [Thamnidium elegans]KAI8057435.1 hypothetical protein BDF21DRAFT_456100 [Thamnidium elegans]
MVIQSLLPPIAVPETGLIQFIFQNTRKTPDNRKLFIDAFTGESLTYGQLKDSILCFAATLQDKFNFQRGDVVAIYSPNQMDYSVPLLGTVAAGGAVSPANPAYTSSELAYQLQMTSAKILIAHETNVEIAVKAADMVGLSRSRIFVFGKNQVQGIDPWFQVFMGERRATLISLTAQEAKETVVYLCFSSGTTGKSKGVMTTHANITANILQYEGSEGASINGDKDRMLGVLPFFHIFGLSLLIHIAIYLGTPVYVMSRFDLVKFCETIQKEKITFSALVPPIVLLLAKDPVVGNYDLSSLNLVICGAAPLSAELSQQTRKRLPTTIIKQAYGLTETSPFASVERTDDVVDGSIGFLLSSMSIKIVDDDGVELPLGQRGELWLKGPNIMKGYINNPKATAECIDKEGYFHSGDIATQDHDGRLYIVDRKKELIKYKGFQVPPAELEGILLTSPIVTDCAVIGLYDASQATELPRGYITLAANVPATEETAEIIKKFVADKVVYYKQLRSIVFIDEIPKSPSGKVLRRVLRDAAAEEQVSQKQKSKL